MANALTDFIRKRDFLVCMDSDGCVMDTVRIKHCSVFCPELIRVFGLEAHTDFITTAWEEINLNSITRGISRFESAVLIFDRLKNRGIDVPGSEDFPGVEYSLHQLHTVADVAVVSAANESAIASEWARYGLATHADVIFGQEVGSKANSIASMLACGYESRKVVMVGDAMGDAQAAAANGVSFVPILPGREAESWRRLQEEALPKLLHGTFSPEYQATLLAQLRSVLHG